MEDLEGAIDRAVEAALGPAFQHLYEEILDEVRPAAFSLSLKGRC